MWPNPQKTADLVTVTEEIRNGKFHFCAVTFLDPRFPLPRQNQEKLPIFPWTKKNEALKITVRDRRQILLLILSKLKGCVRYIFISLLYMPKKEHLWNKEKCFLSHFKSSFCSWDNQVLNFQVLKSHDVIKCLSMKHETYFTEQLGK